MLTLVGALTAWIVIGFGALLAWLIWWIVDLVLIPQYVQEANGD